MRIKHADEMIKDIQNNPNEYLSDETVFNINSFMNSYIGMLMLLGYNNNLDVLFRGDYPRWLERWIRKNIDKEYDMNSFFWCKMLYQILHTEKEALDLFYLTSSQFLKKLQDQKINERKIDYRVIGKEKCHIEEDIIHMKKWPGMHIARNTVSCIFHYFNGYFIALEYAKDKMNESDKAFQNKFASWLD